MSEQQKAIWDEYTGLCEYVAKYCQHVEPTYIAFRAGDGWNLAQLHALFNHADDCGEVELIRTSSEDYARYYKLLMPQQRFRYVSMTTHAPNLMFNGMPLYGVDGIGPGVFEFLNKDGVVIYRGEIGERDRDAGRDATPSPEQRN